MSAKLIESMIPDSLRLAGHPDAELVNRAIATVIVAMDESSAMTLRGMAKDVRRALEGYYQGVYQPHIAKEDEDWSALKTKAQAYEKSEADILRARLSKLWDEKESVYQDYRREESSRERRTLVEAMDAVIAEIDSVEKRLEELNSASDGTGLPANEYRVIPDGAFDSEGPFSSESEAKSHLLSSMRKIGTSRGTIFKVVNGIAMNYKSVDSNGNETNIEGK